MKNNKGFSLVELIVVIAIMAILAAVAVVGVSVYIPKAEQQADSSTLDTLSESFMAACLSVGLDHREVSASFALDENGNLKQDTLKLSGCTDEQKSEIQTLLLATIAGEKISFNMPYGASEFIATVEGRFAFSAKSVSEKVYAGDFWAWDDQIDAYKGSAFGKITADDLTGNVNEIVKQAFGAGLTSGDVAGFDKFYEEVLNGDPNADKTEKMNALVLYAAWLTSNEEKGIDLEKFNSYVFPDKENGETPDMIVNKTQAGKVTQDFVAYEAMKYAIGMAWVREVMTDYHAKPHDGVSMTFVYADASNKKVMNPEDYGQVMAALNKGFIEVTNMNGDEVVATVYFSKWYEANGENAIAGYMGAMGVVDNNKGEFDLSKGFDNYAGVIDQLLGPQQ